MQFSRRSFARFGITAGLGLALGWPALAQAGDVQGPASTLSPDQALQQLLDGNKRYVQQASTHPNLSAEGRMALAAGQSPIAAVLSCIDSRVPPEIVFDQGLGNMFGGRTAGNIVDKTQLGGLEFAVAKFNVSLIVVMGHQSCGAVAAAIDTLNSGMQAPGHIADLVNALEPAVMAAAGQSVDDTTRTHILMTAQAVHDMSEIVSDAVSSGALKIVPMYYSLDTGMVEVLSQS